MTAVLASLLLLGATIAPTGAHAANTCGVFISIDYPSESGPFNGPGDVVRVRLTFGAGSINGGTQVTINKARFDLDCDSGSLLGIGCTDEGAVVEYEGDSTITTSCVGLTFATGHPVGANPNQLEFVATPTFTIPANTSEFCDIEFDVRVLTPSVDPTPSEIQQVAGFDVGQGDAQCDNGLLSSGSASSTILVCPNCDDDDPCTVDSCDESTGACEYEVICPTSTTMSTTTITATSTTTSTTLHGCAPADKKALRCETAIAKAIAQLAKDVIKCSVKDARALVGSNPPVELSAVGDACEMGARAKFDEAVAKIAAKGGCPPSVVANAPSLADDTVAQTRQNLDAIFICPAP